MQKAEYLFLPFEIINSHRYNKKHCKPCNKQTRNAKESNTHRKEIALEN